MSDEIRFPRAMGQQDAILWRMERDPMLRSTSLAVALLDGLPDRGLVRERLRRASLVLPRLRQRVVDLPNAVSTPVWSPDPHFDLDYHLRWVGAPGDGSLGAVLELAAAVAMQSFDASRPLWEFVVVEGMADGKAGLIQKLHHAVTDGSGGVRLMQLVYDLERDAPLPEAPPEHEEAPVPDEGMLQLGSEALLRALGRSPDLARRGAGRLRDAALHPLSSARRASAELRATLGLLSSGPGPLSPILRGRSSRNRFAAFTVPLEDLKSAAHACRCKLGDAFLAAVTAGWRRYHEGHGAEVTALRAAIPLSLRGGGAAMVAGNRLAAARLPLPIGEKDPEKRMRQLRRLVGKERRGAALANIDALAGLLNLVPTALALPFVRMEVKKSDFVATAVPGLPVPLYLAGAEVESMFTFGPPAGSAANVTLFSYRKQAGVALNVDPAAVPDFERLLECMREGFGEVLKLQ
jgi:WS/DGAT/MGAT family acyltransferase